MRAINVAINPTYVVKHGITLGTALAVVASWSVNHSLPWAILHGICSWFYVIYYAIKY